MNLWEAKWEQWLQLSTSAGLHNTEHIINCGFVHLPQTESSNHPVQNMTRHRAEPRYYTRIQMAGFIECFWFCSWALCLVFQGHLLCTPFLFVYFHVILSNLWVLCFALIKAPKKTNETCTSPGPDTGGSGLLDFFGSSRSFSSCFRVLRCRASLNMGKAWAADAQGKQR